MSYAAPSTDEERANEENRRLSSRQQIIQHVKKSLLYTAFDVQWVPHSATLTVVGQYPNNKGAVSLYRLEKGELHTVAEVSVKNPLACCTFGHHGGLPSSVVSSYTVALGDFAGGMHLVDVERLAGTTATEPGSSSPSVLDLTKESIFSVAHAHDNVINAIDGARFSGPPELATGSRDGCVRVWDTRQHSKPIVSLNPATAERARDCWAVRFGNSFDPDERVIAAGYDNGDVKIFDLRTQKMLHEMNVSNGVCDLAFDRPDIAMNKLIVSSLEGRVRCYDLRTHHPTLGYAFVEERVSEGTVWASKPLPQNREVFMSCGGGDMTLLKYRYPPERSLKDGDGVARGVAGAVEELNKATVGDQPINSMDWNASKEGLLACTSFDQSVRVMLVTKLGLVS